MSNLPLKLTIKGHSVSLKNNKVIRYRKIRGRRSVPFIDSNDRVKKWMKYAILTMRKIYGVKPPIRCYVNAKFTFYGAWKSIGSTIPDMSNLYQGPEDAMESAGILENDMLIDSHDGSRRVRMCDTCGDRQLYKVGPKKGMFKPDCGAVRSCPYERVEIELTETLPVRSESSGWVWMVMADHPTLRRPDRMFGTEEEANDYADELKGIGYENISVDGKAPNASVR